MAQNLDFQMRNVGWEAKMKTPSSKFPTKIAICVTCHFVESRLQYLDQISNYFNELAEEVYLTVITNTSLEGELDQIKSVVRDKGFKYSLFTPVGLGHPYLLTWSHFHIFRQLFEDGSFSHFLYLEDDTLITRDNITYWMEGRELLLEFNCFPSFLRVEKKIGDDDWYSADCVQRFRINSLPSIRIGEDTLFVNLPTPYQGMYLLDRVLMTEHLTGKSSSPEFGTWGIREKAAQGLTFLNVRKGFTSRNLISYKIKDRGIDKRCLIHHMPNNNANQEIRINDFGSVPVKELLLE